MQLRLRCPLMATKKMLANPSICPHQTRLGAETVKPCPHCASVRVEKRLGASGWRISHRGLGHGITSACFNIPADGIVDDLKQIICQELSHPRFYLTKRTFRLKLNGNHQPYHIKLDTIDNAAPLTFEWAEPIYITQTLRTKIVLDSSTGRSM